MRNRLKGLAFLCMAVALPLTAQNVTVSGPDGKLQLTVSCPEGKEAAYSLTYNGKQMLESSPLGLETNVGDFAKAMKLTGHKERKIDTVYTQSRIKASKIHYQANELVCAFANAKGQKMDVIFRVSNNDVAFRYTLPRQGERGSLVVNSEATGFRFPEQTTTFMCPQSDAMIGWKRTKPSYEEEYKADAPMDVCSQYGHGYTFPCLFRVGDNGWVLVSETGVDSRYCGSRLSDVTEGNLYTVAFPMAEENNGNGTVAPAFALPGSTPWRTITVGETLKPIVETTVIWDVVEPLYETEHDYQMGRGTWSWILWQDGSINYDDQVRYVDLAAAMGYEYVLIDNWWDTKIGRKRMESLIDYAQGKGSVYVPAEAAQNYTTSGLDYTYGPQKKVNRLLTLYANYNKLVESIKSSFDVTAGYDYQYWKSTTPLYYETNTLGEIQKTSKATDDRHVLLSYYGRLNYSFDSRYMLTTTVRRDATSRFAKNVRWGTFPSVALGWRMTEESFLKDNKILSTLKLRASYGVTGQQDGIGNYNYLPVYNISQSGASSLIGGNPIHTYRPEAYVPDLKWETTTSWNAGFDFGFLQDRITGSFDYYTRQTKDLIATVPAAAGTTFDRNITTNVGNVDSEGIEFSINATPIQTKDWNWDLSFNMTWQKMKVKNLSLAAGTQATNTSVGPYIDSYQLQVLSEGYAPYMFYVYHQLYDEKTGKPVEGAYVDLDGNGEINTNDLYRYHSPAPDYILGFSTSLRYKKWTLSTSLRANIGNYVYNAMAMNAGAWETVSYNSYQLNNLSRSYLETGFKSRQYLSDYYVENASFLKMDNLSLGYNFGEIYKGCSLNVSAMVQNVFCITKYSGVDPEVPNGVDNSFYPRPRTFSLNIGLNF